MKLLDGALHVAEEVVGDAELEVQLRLVASTGVDFALQRIGGLAQAAQLRAALGQPVAQLLHGACVAIFVFDQQRFQIDERFAHKT